MEFQSISNEVDPNSNSNSSDLFQTQIVENQNEYDYNSSFVSLWMKFVPTNSLKVKTKSEIEGIKGIVIDVKIHILRL